MIERAKPRNVLRDAVFTLGVGVFTLAGCGGGSGGSPPLISTSTTLSASPASVVLGATVTLAAAVQYAPAETASGTVDFLDNGATIGSSTLDPKGVGSLKIATLAVGSHSVTAAYLGNNTTSASMSSAVTVTVKAKGSSGVSQFVPIEVAISTLPKATFAKFAIAAKPEDMGCVQPSSVVVQENNNGNWRLYCSTGNLAAGEKSQSYEMALPGEDQMDAIAPDSWFLDTSGQPYILLQASPRIGKSAEPTP